MVVKGKRSSVQGKPLQGCCIAGEGNEEVAVSREGTGRRDQLQKEATGLTHRIKSPELLPGRSVINPQGSGGSEERGCGACGTGGQSLGGWGLRFWDCHEAEGMSMASAL